MLISEQYRALNAQLHRDKPGYGEFVAVFAGENGQPRVKDNLASLVIYLTQKFETNEVLDYGAGKGGLKRLLTNLAPNLAVVEYDPAIPGKNRLPEPSGVVACLDVMEHIEPECLDDVLEHLRALTQKAIILSIDMGPALKTLADGRNAHLIIEDSKFWLPKITKLWHTLEVMAGKRKIVFMGFA